MPIFGPVSAKFGALKPVQDQQTAEEFLDEGDLHRQNVTFDA